MLVVATVDVLVEVAVVEVGVAVVAVVVVELAVVVFVDELQDTKTSEITMSQTNPVQIVPLFISLSFLFLNSPEID